MFDIKIVNGSLLDGSGSPAVRADLGITGDRIADIGDLGAAGADVVIDADGLVVTPGFIDVHSHSDTYLLIRPSADSKIWQGITTEVVGNCGASAAPLTGAYRMPSDWRDKEYPSRWNTVAEYRAILEQVKPAPNVVLLVGHTDLRAGIVGYDNRPASSDELKRMSALLDRALEEGGRGLSTGLIYAPAMFAPSDELIALARVASARGGIYSSHMRNEGGRLLAAIDEAVRIGREAGIGVEISHFKTSGRENWHLVDKAIESVRKARASGVDVCADRYPYTSSCTDLDVILPRWAADGGHDAVMARLKDPGIRARLLDEVRQSRPADAWGTIMIGSTAHSDHEAFKGVRLDEVAGRMKMEPADAALRIMEKDELRTSAFFFGMNEDNMRRILAEPYVMIGSDASLRALDGPLSLDYPHPRAYGSFPKFLRMSLDGVTVPLPEAVRKMTSLPASRFGLKDRGMLRKGMKADVTVIDTQDLADTATYARPHSLARGIESVIVNGTLTLHNNRLTGNRAGRFL